MINNTNSVKIKPILILFIFVFVLLYSSIPAHAQGFTQEDLDALYTNQVYRDPIATELVCATPGDVSDPGANSEAVWRFFADKLPAHQIAGIIGNMTIESGVQPQRLEGTGSGVITPAESVDLAPDRVGWGLVQWTPARKIINTMSPKSAANNINNQLQFLWDQLEGRGPSGEKRAGDHLKLTTNLRDATVSFAEKYERPAAHALRNSLEARVAAANGAMARYADSIPTVAEPVNSPEGESPNYATGCDNPSEGAIVDTAKAELTIGAVEYDDRVMEYTDGNREAWCADFVSWVYRESGNPFSGGLSGGWRRPSVRDMQAMFKNTEGLEYFSVDEKVPQPGDVAFYLGEQTPDGGSTSHVNIVIEVNGREMTTIGGNESNRVKKSTRIISLGSQSLVGFGRIVR